MPRATAADTTVDRRWRNADADALEARVVAIQNWLAHTDNLLEQAEHHDDDQVALVLRSACGLLRERRNTLAEHANALRVADRG